MFNYSDKTILIVDDQKPFHVMLKTMLTNQGAKNINFAETADQAVRIANRVQYDIYLLDYNLGSGKNGAQLLDYLKRNQLVPNHALCFIITGDSSKGMVLTAIEKSPDDYLMKPFSQVQLSNRLAAATKRKLIFQDIFQSLSEEKYEQAIQQCKEKIDKETKHRSLCKNLLADIYIQIEEFSAAETILKPLIDLRPLVRPSISLGKAYYLQKKYVQAIEVLKRLIEYTPLQMEAYRWLARAYKDNGELEKALVILTQAAETTNHSIERHQEVVLLANEMQEHKIMLNSYSAILSLNRNSFYPDPCHLANYIRSIIEFAKQEKDMGIRKNILKKVNSTLYQSRFEEGRNHDFNFAGFDEICQAKVSFAMDEPLKAKRRIFNTLRKTEEPISEFDTTFLTETLFSLLEIGEFEEAAPYLKELETRDIIDPTTAINIKKQTGEGLTTRMKSFKGYNQMGIKYFSAGALEEALDSFDQALALEPLNSGALLNRSQVLIRILQDKADKDKDRNKLVKQCQNSFLLLSNTHLPENHAKRLSSLLKELRELT
ncbi:tetratricopeptide repeat protein [Psychromonas algicola]|uniref:tetratricopeptide repeat protein n=1 Tax=Psychromonas algicola TaxID=2555642 RepID=UPI001068BA04|nr:tetratricopeptide repeat protein [Psychromonas sp. RZ5]TEW49255.1 response regulator [Psychromonas sp. RZ5]